MAATTPHKPAGDAAGTTFSYAQAAKGRSPSVPNTALELEKPSTKRTASEGQASPGDNLKLKQSPETAPFGKVTANKSSAPSSPDFGAASTSTLTKDDEPFSPQNGFSESTSDRQSDNSQNGFKVAEKPDAEKPSSEPSWNDDAPAPVALKEAPLPAVNFWHQRKEAQEAKTRANKQTNSLAVGSVEPHQEKPALSRSPTETRKQDNQRKPKGNPHGTEGPLIAANTKDANKLPDSKVPSGDEVPTKPASRLAKGSEMQRANAPATVPLAAPGDAMSWPTPDSALGEEKRKAQERAEKAEKDKGVAPLSKPHGQPKWVTIPFVPTAKFNTPIPQTRRGGGRPNRGNRDGGTGRGGSTAQSGNDSEKAAASLQDSSNNQSPAAPTEGGRMDYNSLKHASSGSRPKRSASAGPPTARDQRKAGDLSSTEKRKEHDQKAPKSNIDKSTLLNGNRAVATAQQTEREGFGGPVVKSTNADTGRPNGQAYQVPVDSGNRRPSTTSETQTYARPGGPDRRSEAPRPSDHPRDPFAPVPIRERGDGRLDRGRGGYRSRGNGHQGFPNASYINGHGVANGHPASNPTPSMQSAKLHSNQDRQVSQAQATSYSQSYNHPRSLRSNSRSRSIAHSGPFTRYPNGSFTGPPHLANIQTDIANTYGYPPGQQDVMSAVPPNPYNEAFSLYPMVSMQMEYYFSLDNLCKDMFLRKHMDSQGFVFLSVIANFNRIRQLTQDMDLIRVVCLNSPNIEIRTAADGIDRLRKREGWQQWVLGMEKRDPSAQNQGPAHLQPLQLPQPPVSGAPYGYDIVADPSIPYQSQATVIDDGLSKQEGFSPPFGSNESGSTINGNITGAPVMQTPVSAAVPDIASSLTPSSGHGLSPSDPHAQKASSFTDEQVESLMIICRKAVNTSAPQPPPFVSAASRTFSNGSVDGRTINEELARFDEHQTRPPINGTGTLELNDPNGGQRSRSPFNLSSPKRQANSSASPVFWVKDKETPIDSLPSDLTHESYNVFRVNALQQRQQTGSGVCHRDMEILYQFWSHFLIRNFNTRMYEEFRGIAFEDASKRDSRVGLENLVQYYNASMIGEKIMADDIAHDYVDLVMNEGSGAERPAFDRLRAAWRNGATNMKNRKKISHMLDPDLKDQLER